MQGWQFLTKTQSCCLETVMHKHQHLKMTSTTRVLSVALNSLQGLDLSSHSVVEFCNMMSLWANFGRGPEIRKDREPLMFHEVFEVHGCLRAGESRSVNVSVPNSSLMEAEGRIPLWSDPSQFCLLEGILFTYIECSLPLVPSLTSKGSWKSEMKYEIK